MPKIRKGHTEFLKRNTQKKFTLTWKFALKCISTFRDFFQACFEIHPFHFFIIPREKWIASQHIFLRLMDDSFLIIPFSMHHKNRI